MNIIVNRISLFLFVLTSVFTQILISYFILHTSYFNYAYAQVPTVAPPSLPKSDIENLNPAFTASGLPAQIITIIYKVVLPLAGFLTIIFIVISGIQFITSSGNPEGAASARSRLIFAIVGMVIIILAFAILQIVNQLFLGNTGIA